MDEGFGERPAENKNIMYIAFPVWAVCNQIGILGF
jgi:hypothetical protein